MSFLLWLLYQTMFETCTPVYVLLILKELEHQEPDLQISNETFYRISFLFIHSSVFSLRGQVGRNQSPVMWPVWLWHTASWASSCGQFAIASLPPLDVPTFAARCLYVHNDRDPSSERWNCLAILPKFRLPRKFRDLLHAANLWLGTDSFTSPPNEGMLRIFSP